MTALASLATPSEAVGLPLSRAARWLALVLVVAALATPDCCLSGAHLMGAGMDGFWPICHAVR